MKYLSTFTGIGGFERGIHTVIPDAECIGYSEVNEPAIKTYEEHYEHHNFGDITAIEPVGLPDFDLIVGGFPCQAFSVAGKRRGFDEARGTLFFDVARILKDKRPRHLVLENVAGLLSHDSGKTFEVILGILTDLGYDVEWQLLNSKDFGVPQNRQRVYIVGHLGNRCGRKIFPIFGQDGQSSPAGDHEPSGQEKFIKTRHLSQNGGLISDSMTLQASEIPHVIAGIQGQFTTRDGDAYALDATYQKGVSNLSKGKRTHIVQEPKIITGSPKYSEDGKRYMDYKVTDEAPTIRATQHKSGDNQPKITDGVRIRRLTPTECERLQGFPDNWTIGSDTQRYKQCGNAVTTNVVQAVMTALLPCLED